MSDPLKPAPAWLIAVCNAGVTQLAFCNRLPIGAGDLAVAAKVWAATIANGVHLPEPERDADRMRVAFQKVAAGDGQATPRAVMNALPRLETPTAARYLPKPTDREAERNALHGIAARLGTGGIVDVNNQDGVATT